MYDAVPSSSATEEERVWRMVVLARTVSLVPFLDDCDLDKKRTSVWTSVR